MNTSHFKELLETEKGTLERQLATVGQKTTGGWEARATEVGQESDPNDQAGTIESYEDNTAIINDLEARYNDVVAALGRVDDGTYGTCTVGGEPIEEERLAADPAAATCTAHIS